MKYHIVKSISIYIEPTNELFAIEIEEAFRYLKQYAREIITAKHTEKAIVVKQGSNTVSLLIECSDDNKHNHDLFYEEIPRNVTVKDAPVEMGIVSKSKDVD